MNAPAQGATGAVAPAALIPILCLFATGSLLGLSTSITAIGVASGWAPIAFVFWTALGSGLVLLIVSVVLGDRPKLSGNFLRYAVLSGLLGFALPNMLSFSAISHVGAGFVALCFAFPPLLTYAMALFLGMDRATRKGCAGMVLGLGGASLLALSGPIASDTGRSWALLALSAPVVIAMGNIYRTIDWPKGVSTRLLAAAMLLGAALVVGIYAIAAGISLTPADWSRGTLQLLLMQVTCVAATYALYFVLQKLSGPVGLSQIGWIGAGVGKILAVTFLGETVPMILAPASAMILAGIALVSRRAG